jgi:hypothetical protein
MTEIAWNQLSAAALRGLAERNAVVLLPVASTEQHGPHLPTGVDDFLCSAVCRRTATLLADDTPAVVAPTVWCGLADHHTAFGGTFTLSLATYHALLRDLCRSILAADPPDFLFSDIPLALARKAREMFDHVGIVEGSRTSGWPLRADAGAARPQNRGKAQNRPRRRLGRDLQRGALISIFRHWRGTAELLARPGDGRNEPGPFVLQGSVARRGRSFPRGGLAHGATCNGAPGVRRPPFYCAFLIDLDGNNVERDITCPGSACLRPLCRARNPLGFKSMTTSRTD